MNGRKDEHQTRIRNEEREIEKEREREKVQFSLKAQKLKFYPNKPGWL